MTTKSLRNTLIFCQRLFNLLNMEIWKDIKGYEGLYQVSNLGRVKSLPKSWTAGYGGINTHNGKILKGTLSSTRYNQVELYKNKSNKKYTIHRLVAMEFIPNLENKPFINHKNGIKTDNYIENLEWCTNSENQIHAYREGLQKKRGNHYKAKIVLNTTTGIFYESVTDAAEAHCLNRNTLSGYLTGAYKNKTDLIYPI